ncbi:hypothetical protein A3I27_02990 [Candidatus Giovannonibacteria bacterium RIFCSPLOWO2_02_FULL_43_11b]|uniref:Uncharacterized protein n=1 Tax=Candidatus Giovannonibacteria bacterium RIFCSPHIGHO2_12_FULL_43_15 TaxID=1798341 RepID=A0A1F5WQF2_9BACT|nr:MAG: hypothetical protein A2739_03225 [Candidatus Giovannonibacteria bacterium RIFCSPHIGHO2_01_FULL_43_100]OGF67578.1 MAG: hypothetical protein A3B97_00755 [Candidatus Giovannonibacteria bacterium RIFCSPHIGHO2_02_FULL_43_32]OGF77885.1 MAG: hypothetical protein A3F23_02545 [Candidatus Giovannonibacteria bacterium RIFCSPHIGHO2_12_FULL_43_15]OGF79078.1 MAG: hypothetical protein A3A15_03735 [Candidatus Giovannonibacteria bacterium RIFCSPLOWO2_01_FULL_43_60]OGF89557.1 MAG: hypothetical protein A3
MRSQYSGTLDPATKELFQPDTLALDEYMSKRKSRVLGPEKELMLAILEDAVHCFQKYIFAKYSKERAWFNDAEAWLMLMDDSDRDLFSFVNICNALELDPSYLRQGLIKWKSRQSQSEIKRRV